MFALSDELNPEVSKLVSYAQSTPTYLLQETHTNYDLYINNLCIQLTVYIVLDVIFVCFLFCFVCSCTLSVSDLLTAATLIV